MLRPALKGKAAHLAYYLARPYWGSRLEADVDQGNAASIQILEKFGFSVAGREEIAASGRVLLRYELPASDREKK